MDPSSCSWTFLPSSDFDSDDRLDGRFLRRKLTALPEVVSKLFMLDDTFFRSPFLREKLPMQLFSNGSDGFGRFFSDFGSGTPMTRSARSSFYPSDRFDDDDLDGDSEGPPTPTLPFNQSNGSGSSAFDFRRRSEPASEHGSGTIIRNIPIRVEQRQSNPNQANYYQPPAASQAPPPPPQPQAQPQPQQTPVNNGMPNYLRQSSYPAASSGQNASGYRSMAARDDEANNANGGGDAYSLRSFNFPSEERAASLANSNNSIGAAGSNGLYATIRRTKSSGRVSPSPHQTSSSSTTSVPEPPQRRSFSHLLQPYRNQTPLTTPAQQASSSATSSNPNFQHQQPSYSHSSSSSTATLQPPPPTHIAPPPPAPTSSSATPVPEPPTSTYNPNSYPYQRPTSPMSQKSRPKSPSLQSLRAGFRKATNCVRRHENDGSDAESEFRAAVPSGSTSTSSLYATIHRPKPNPSPLRHTSTSRTMEEELDAVEEAIRSLESFDPHKIIADAAAQHRRESAVSGSDSDTGSVLLRSSDARTSESPTTSSGIVADMIHDSPQRASTISNRSSTEATSSSSSDHDNGSYVLPAETVPLYSNARYTNGNALPQPPAVARVAHSGSFGPSPQRAVVSSPNATLTRAPNARPKPINIDTTSNVTPTASPMLPRTVQEAQQAQLSDDTDIDETDDAATMRKRMLCAQMTDCAKVIEINGLKMSQFTTAPNWRHPHMLARNIPNIQDTVYIIEAALDELLEFTQRISIPRHDVKHAELVRLVAPLHTSQALIHRLRAKLDSVNWSVGALSRVPGMPYTSDSLDQFVAILHQLPKDCRQLVQWAYLLGPAARTNDGGARFLPRSSPGASPFPVSTPVPRELLTPVAAPEHRIEIPNQIPDGLAPRGSGNGSLAPQGTVIHRLSPVPPLRAPTVEEIAMDGGESTTSSNGSSATEVPSPGGTTPTQQSVPSNNRGGEILEEDDLSSIADSTRQVYEEDDLASVMSDTSSLYQDYSLLDGAHGSLPRSRGEASRPKLNPLLLKDLSDEERELLRFYAPQLDTHTQGLCRLIDEFFAVVEQAEAPAKFVQKVRLIILEAQTLVYIGDNMAQCVATPALRAEFRHASDRLNSLRTQCVNHAKVAKEQYPNVTAVKAMMNSVIAVSDAAQSLKHLGKACA
uniref:Rab-GAP TBC domain-containing protein n=1 Tax=Panagrellus redivivus TaxID=6233 RepID=A0A7E4V2I5_PANRE